MVVTDLDGTLLNDKKKVSEKDYATLLYLDERGIPRVIATGRSRYSVSKVLPDDFPIDYLVFSSGAGCMDWRSKELLFSHSLNVSDISAIFSILAEKQADFSIHHPIPDNHHFTYFRNNGDNPDFERRISYYGTFGIEGGNDCPPLDKACQFLVVQRTGPPAVTWQELAEVLPGFNVVRTTSPIDGVTEWIEIFPSQVSKSQAADHIRRTLFPGTSKVLGVGNDYNDLQLLRWADMPRVVGNAPEELRKEFQAVSSNNDNGFSAAVAAYLEAEA